MQRLYFYVVEQSHGNQSLQAFFTSVVLVLFVIKLILQNWHKYLFLFGMLINVPFLKSNNNAIDRRLD